MNRNRRKLLLGLAGVCASSTALSRTLLTTPSQSAGPFYPLNIPLDDDNDLTHVAGQGSQAQGIISDLSGKIVDINGHPLPEMRIEIWQCDANGRYRHPGDDGAKKLDKSFQGHGHTTTDELGRYRFRTIRPVVYPGRTPHIHIAVFAPGEAPFVTQLYVKDDPGNQQDFLFRHVPVERRHLVLADFIPAKRAEVELDASFDIILNRQDGTPQQPS